MRAPLAWLSGVILAVSAAHAGAAPGVNDDRVLFGQTAAFEGPAAALGNGMNLGLRAAFTPINEDGGVNGRQLEITKANDGYEPDQAIANTKRFINDETVFGLIGPVGTPTSKAIQPIAEESGVPYIGPFTGAAFLRKPENANVVNIRGAHDDEAEAWMKYLVDDQGHEDIAILYQDDSYGRAGLSGVKKALDKRDMSLAAEATYPRNTTAVKSAALDISGADPDAVVTVGAYKPVAEFIRVMKQLGADVPVVNLSFTGSAALAEELSGETDGNVFVTQVVPHPENSDKPIVTQYREDLSAVAPDAEPGFVSLEGYLVGRVTAEVLGEMDGAPTRDGFLKQVEAMGTFDLGGLEFSYGPEDNQGLETIFLTRLTSDGSYETVETY